MRPDFALEHDSSWSVNGIYPSSGPMVLESISPEEEAVLVKNENYWDAENVTLEKACLLYTSARSKGTPMIKVILGHALKNCLIPVVTYAGPLLAFLITGSFVIESLFSIPGIGSEFVNSVTNRDYTMIMALTILFGNTVDKLRTDAGNGEQEMCIRDRRSTELPPV